MDLSILQGIPIGLPWVLNIVIYAARDTSQDPRASIDLNEFCKRTLRITMDFKRFPYILQEAPYDFHWFHMISIMLERGTPLDVSESTHSARAAP